MTSAQPHSSDLLQSLFTSKADANITRLAKVLSTSSGVDAALTLVGYGLFLTSSQLSKLQNAELSVLNRLVPTSSSATALKAGVRSLVTLAQLEASTKTLAGMCSDFRTFTRLWGLLGVYAMTKRQYLDPPRDALLSAVGWTQTAALGAYYLYENGYYLAGKGVLHGWTAGDIKKCAKTSLKCFLAYVVLEYVKLYRARQLREERKATAISEKEKADLEKEENVWWKTAAMDVAYTPLGMHWASEEGLLGDGAVGALMTIVGLIKVRTAWALTA